MAQLKRRDLLIGAGAVAAAGGAGVAAAAGSGSSGKPLVIDVSRGTPTLPTDKDLYRFRSRLPSLRRSRLAEASPSSPRTTSRSSKAMPRASSSSCSRPVRCESRTGIQTRGRWITAWKAKVSWASSRPTATSGFRRFRPAHRLHPPRLCALHSQRRVRRADLSRLLSPAPRAPRVPAPNRCPQVAIRNMTVCALPPAGVTVSW